MVSANSRQAAQVMLFTGDDNLWSESCCYASWCYLFPLTHICLFLYDYWYESWTVIKKKKKNLKRSLKLFLTVRDDLIFAMLTFLQILQKHCRVWTYLRVLPLPCQPSRCDWGAYVQAVVDGFNVVIVCAGLISCAPPASPVTRLPACNSSSSHCSSASVTTAMASCSFEAHTQIFHRVLLHVIKTTEFTFWF